MINKSKFIPELSLLSCWYATATYSLSFFVNSVADITGWKAGTLELSYLIYTVSEFPITPKLACSFF